jgi:hypothetical protein
MYCEYNKAFRIKQIVAYFFDINFLREFPGYQISDNFRRSAHDQAGPAAENHRQF